MFLLDTNVVSDAQKRVPEPRAWIGRNDPNALYVSVITIGEIERGIVRLRKHDQLKAARLASWMGEIRRDSGDRILPVTEEVALTWGRLSAVRSRNIADGLIAATALVHGLVIVTRNVADFQEVGVAVINPWES